MPIQWMIVVPDDDDEAVIDLLNRKITQAVEVAAEENPTATIKFSVLHFQEVEIL